MTDLHSHHIFIFPFKWDAINKGGKISNIPFGQQSDLGFVLKKMGLKAPARTKNINLEAHVPEWLICNLAAKIRLIWNTPLTICWMKKSVTPTCWNISTTGSCVVLHAEAQTTTFIIADGSLFCSSSVTIAMPFSTFSRGQPFRAPIGNVQK